VFFVFACSGIAQVLMPVESAADDERVVLYKYLSTLHYKRHSFLGVKTICTM